MSRARRRLLKKVQLYLQIRPPHDPTVKWCTEVLASIHALDGIIIKPSDKGFETVILDVVWYKTECLRQLSDITTYRVTAPHYPLVWAKLRLLLLTAGRLYESAGTKTRTALANYLLQLEDAPTLRLARFYCLIKLHKTPVVGRPIVSSINTATFYASRWLDSRLQMFLYRIPAYLQSSEHLLTILERTRFTPDCVLVAADITSLYPNIPIKEGISALRAQLLKWSVSTDEVDFIVALSHWVLTNNYMEFASVTYQQISGTAMGTPFAVVFANIFLSHLEDELQPALAAGTLPTPQLFKRYVDDLFVVCDNAAAAADFIAAYNARYPTIKLTSLVGDSVNFMDLRIHKGQRHEARGLLDVELYSSPTHKFLYLPPWSFHPKTIFPSFISAERKRIRKNNSNDVTHAEHDLTFRHRLEARGYTDEYLEPLFATLLNRNALIRKAALSVAGRIMALSKTVPEPPLVFKTAYSPLTEAISIRHCLKLSRSALDDVDAKLLFTDKDPVMCYTRNRNLGDILCRSLFR